MSFPLTLTCVTLRSGFLALACVQIYMSDYEGKHFNFGLCLPFSDKYLDDAKWSLVVA